tara:strand:- start:37 stop:1110 length:1074 start_codon:yes stop_codon:yes gene_type:complete
MTTNIQEVRIIKPEDAVRSRISLEEFYNYKVFPNQRPHKKRARDLKWQEKMLRPHNDHYEVKSVRCGCDIANPINPNQVYKKGDKIKTDGHTTVEFFAVVCKEIDNEHLAHLPPTHLNDTQHDVYNWEELQDAFNVYDNNASVFKGSDKFFGAARINGLIFNNFNAVQSIASLEYAAWGCYPSNYEKGKSSTNQEANRMMKDVGQGFVWLDSVISDSEFGNQIALKPLLKCAYVMSYNLYNGNEEALDGLKRFVLDVSGDKLNSRPKDQDSCTFFIRRWKQIVRKEYSAETSSLNRSEASKNTLSFTLKMIDDFIKGETRQSMVKSSIIKKYLEGWRKKFDLNQSSSGLKNVLYDAS